MPQAGQIDFDQKKNTPQYLCSAFTSVLFVSHFTCSSLTLA